jgi:hypothetical protein
LRQNRSVSVWSKKDSCKKKSKHASRWRWTVGRSSNSTRRIRNAGKLKSTCAGWPRKRPKERQRRSKSKRDKLKSTGKGRLPIRKKRSAEEGRSNKSFLRVLSQEGSK